MSKYVFFLGSNAALSVAEVLTTLRREGFGHEVVYADEKMLMVEIEKELPTKFLRGLGGIEKLARVIDEREKMWSAEDVLDVIAITPSNSPSRRGRNTRQQKEGSAGGESTGEGRVSTPLPDKWRLGVSGIGFDARELRKLGLDIKKAAKEKNSKVRFVMPKGRSDSLNAAQVLFNRLYEKPHRELIFIKIPLTLPSSLEGERGNLDHELSYVLAETVDVQRIDEYEKRDTQRPARDAQIGMLPPKLAQIMLNVVPDISKKAPIIVDPFCGMGTLLQEGWLKNYQMVGSDIRDTMAAASRQNLKWLDDNFSLSSRLKPEVFTHDIRAPYADERWNSAEAIVTEPFLGEPLSGPLSPTEVEKYFENVWPLYDALFRRGREILLPNGYMVVVLPAVKVLGKEGSWTLFPTPFIDSLSKIGYSWQQLVPSVSLYKYEGTERGSVLYARPDAWVGREITLWQREV